VDLSLSPLTGLSVVEVGSSCAARLCGKLLADAGAAVTRFEQSPDEAGAPLPVGAGWAPFLDLGKVVVPDASADGVERTLAGSDLYLTSLRHGESRAAGLDCTSVLERFPDLVAACVTPFGQHGPYAGFLADDAVLCALGGIADSTPGFPDRTASLDDPPTQSVAPLAQVAGGIAAACAVTGAIAGAGRGRGAPRHVEVATLEAAVTVMVYEWAVASYAGRPWGRRPIDHPLPEPNSYLPCADGSAVVVAFREEHWRALVELMGSPAWAAAPEFETGTSRGVHWRELHGRLAAWTRGLAGQELMELAQSRGLPCSHALELSQTLAGEQVRVRGSVGEVAGIVLPADPVVVDGVRRARAAAPAAPRRPLRERADALAGGPLAGVRVVDLSHMIAGPVCGQVLAALGAEVTLVESARYLVTRSLPPFAGEPVYDASAVFNHVHRGKRSVEIDLTTGRGQELLDRLVATADVVIENLSAGAAAKLGLGYERLAAVNERIVLVSISGLGRVGPWGDYAALHSSVIALSGLASATKDTEGRPRLVGSMYPDPLCGLYAALAAQQAILDRERTGRGCHVEVAMLDVALTAMAGLVDAAARGASVEPSDARFVRAADGWVVVPPERADELATRTRREAMQALQADGVPAGAVLDLTEVMADPHLTERGFVVPVAHPVVGVRPMPAVPWLFDGRRPELGPAPTLGDATVEVLTALGQLSAEEVAELRVAGVVA
jgi:crotonobetainyl-CoA:carnitine CoA-transferase CaiB-like acyl-CoA transferase